MSDTESRSAAQQTDLAKLPASTEPTAEPGKSAGRPRLRRFVLMVLLPGTAAVFAINAYLESGRFIETDNAYVKAHVVNVAAEVSGSIEDVLVEEHDRVEPGTVLFRLRDEPYRINVARAESALANVASEIMADKAEYQRALAQIEQSRSTGAYARTQYERQVRLRQRNLGSAEDLDTAAYTLKTAEQQIEVSSREAAALLARLDGKLDADVESYPRYQAAAAEYRQAMLDLARTEVRASLGGVVINRPEPGDYAERGMTTMAIVADDGMWIEANFKETQLTYVSVGQPVSIEIDTYPGKTRSGRIQSLSEATGAEFALLPPQNATGNWVKIVQRIPVRIAVDPSRDAPPLRAGMSTTVSVDTGHTRTWRDLLPD